jgi:hypothetical protein
MKGSKINSIAMAGIFTALIMGVQAMGILPLTGVIVNTVLIVLTLLNNRSSAVFLCFLPSATALISGVIPAPLIGLQPFIIGGNLILFFVFSRTFRKKPPHMAKNHFQCNQETGVLEIPFKKFVFTAFTAAISKALFISFGGFILIKYFIPESGQIILKVILTLQFFTALTGAFAAWAIIFKIKSMEKK